MTKPMKIVTTVAAVAASLPDLIGKLDTELKDIAEQMAALKKAGLIYANEHMKDGKYLVLLHPSQAGDKRVREYVGKDTQKIKEARDAIQRAKDYDELGRQSERLEQVLAQGHRSLQEAARILSTRKLY